MTLYLGNLAIYSLQLAAVVATALTAAWLLRLRLPRASLGFWHSVMATALLLPFAQPRRANDLLQLVVQSDSAAAVAQSSAPLLRAGVDVATSILVILALGVALRLAWLGIGLIRLRSIVANAAADESLEHIAADLGGSLGVTARLLITGELEGPATIGVRQPVVLVPRSVLEMSAAAQRAIICHELLHVRRRDWLHTIAEELWCAALWFHPGARVIASRLSLARETMVDELTILITRDRRAYAEALLAFSNPQPHVIGATPFIGRRTLSQRVALIAEEVPMSRHRALLSSVIALTTVIAVTAGAVNWFPMSTTLSAQSLVYEPGNGITLPVVVKEVKPQYTAAAMEKKIQGSVWMKVVVGANGDVTDVKVTRSLDAEFGLDQAALDAAWQWKFKPGRKDGQPVAVRVTIELTFTLKK